ncbi:aldehyde dehydrogenase (NADP(+)) [Pseudarthrobacter sp. NPDC055928]|uniref:aldehyde dehydrogenase (NADP(+)) n=1 Tax=Pseudarthrobacter sp. NPDC055928 TaxID=3345661 RepID=UPI0035E26A0E
MNPATDHPADPLRTSAVADSTPAEVTAACSAAADAAAELGGSLRSQRSAFLNELANELEQNREALEGAAARETSLAASRLSIELARTARQARLFAEVLDDGGYLEAAIDHATATTPDTRLTRIPLGPVAVFGAGNFPLAFGVPGGDTVSALAAGCPVVVKVHPGHPHTSQLAFEAIQLAAAKSGMPPGTIALVSGMEAGRNLVMDPNIQAVGFTGSTTAGRILFDLASSRPSPIPFYGELGSLNPLVVTAAAAQARPRGITAQLASSITSSVGQLCTKPGLIFIPYEAGDALVASLAEAVRKAPALAMLNEGIMQRFNDSVEDWNAAGAVSVLVDSQQGGPAGAHLVSVDIGRLTGPLLEEAFGPAAVIVRYSTQQQVINTLRSMGGQLTATLLCEEAETDALQPIAQAMTSRAGRLVFNDMPTGVAVSWSMTHGGPYPATTNSGHTSVGSAAIKRWLRPVTYQNAPDTLLPPELREESCGIPRRLNGSMTR